MPMTSYATPPTSGADQLEWQTVCLWCQQPIRLTTKDGWIHSDTWHRKCAHQ